ncbi:Homeodomain-like protein, partial [Fennellomyces sp. T-0311]
WTPEEDNLLRLAVQLYGDKTEKWAKIAACVPGRTNKNCRKRWFHSLDPSLRKGAWTDEEDQLLREGVMRFPNQWSKIADMLEGRTDDQCAKRWRESLDPSIDRSDWTPTEDQRLMEKYEEYGSQWQKIAQFFDGRPGLHCRNRWRKLQRMM